MTQNREFKIGVFATIVAAICCFSPVLYVLAGAVGLSAFVMRMGFVLLPGLAIFSGLSIWALWRRSRT
jgi:mercuric ion transport protein